MNNLLTTSYLHIFVSGPGLTSTSPHCRSDDFSTIDTNNIDTKNLKVKVLALKTTFLLTLVLKKRPKEHQEDPMRALHSTMLQSGMTYNNKIARVNATTTDVKY